MDLKILAKKVAKYAPLLGTVLGGPLGGAAGSLVSAIAHELGVDPSEAQENPEKLLSVINNNPEVAVKLKEVETKLKVELQRLVLEQARLQLEEEKIRLSDVADARSREEKIVEATGRQDVYLYVLASTVTIGFFGLCGLLMFHPIPQGSNQVVFMLFGALSAGFGQVLQYFFGSSKSSSEKTKALTAIQSKTIGRV